MGFSDSFKEKKRERREVGYGVDVSIGGWYEAVVGSPPAGGAGEEGEVVVFERQWPAFVVSGDYFPDGRRCCCCS